MKVAASSVKLGLAAVEATTSVTGGRERGNRKEAGQTWLVGKLLTAHSINKEDMMDTMRPVWKLLRDAKVTILDANLFLFKFATKKDKVRIHEGSPWSFDKHLLVFEDCDGDLRSSDFIFDQANFCVIIVHGEIERDHNKDENGAETGVQQYGDWVRASPLARKAYMPCAGSEGKFRKLTGYEALVVASQENLKKGKEIWGEDDQ
ncbi:hypothetical protein CRYUN_Cryun41cG0050700 [Craigia yunnanensis]